jgi:hypothetical protein
VPCNDPLENGLHLCLACPFAKAVWDQILSWENFTRLQLQPQVDPVHIRAWWEEAARKVPKSERRRLNRVVIYTFWNIWKERNRIIFNNAVETVPQVTARIKEDRANESFRLCLAASSPWGECFPLFLLRGPLKPPLECLACT